MMEVFKAWAKIGIRNRIETITRKINKGKNQVLATISWVKT
jgi:hypothetical protein